MTGSHCLHLSIQRAMTVIVSLVGHFELDSRLFEAQVGDGVHRSMA
jgi:hypothetical protein